MLSPAEGVQALGAVRAYPWGIDGMTAGWSCIGHQVRLGRVAARSSLLDAHIRTVEPLRLADVTKIALAIAGSEASGGAGAQTDLKTFHQLGVFGCTSLTCIVSFDPANGWGHRFVPVDPQVIHDQIEAAVAVHGRIDAVKIGMLGTPTTIGVVAEALERYQFPKVILDPVLICKGQEPGAALDTDNALREKVLPHADVVTPNLFETQTLAGVDEIASVAALKDAAKRIGDQGVPVVIAKAGTLLGTGTALDVYYDGHDCEVL